MRARAGSALQLSRPGLAALDPLGRSTFRAMPRDPQHRTNPSLRNRRPPPDRTAPLLWSHTAQPFPSPLLCSRFDATALTSVPACRNKFRHRLGLPTAHTRPPPAATSFRPRPSRPETGVTEGFSMPSNPARIYPRCSTRADPVDRGRRRRPTRYPALAEACCRTLRISPGIPAVPNRRRRASSPPDLDAG